MKVCIAEKPSVAKEIAQIVGANSRRDGYFEGNGYQVTWTFGHFCTLKEPDDYSPEWKRWKLYTLPMLPDRFGIKLIKNPGIAKQFNTIKSLIDDCELVINCGDAGIEGEVIQRWVLAKAKCKKPVKRLWISSLTEEAIREGFNSLKDAADFDLLYAAGNSRAVGDWLLGMNATRLYTLKYADNKGVLSIGRVQTPTLALIVERQHIIDNFKSETYWELKTKYREVEFSAEKKRFDKLEEANKLIESIRSAEFEIISFSKKKGKELPPKLLDLTSLQVEANRKYALSADETLKLTQKLYERKLLTYPRVDTVYLPNDLYPKIEGILKRMTPYEKYTAPLLTGKIRKSSKVFDDKKVTDHHAIIPTGVNPGSLSLSEKQIYDIVARRFIAAFYPDCIVSNTQVSGEAAKVKFSAFGKQILEEGWRTLFPKKKSSNEKKDQKEKNDSQIMPEFVKGERGPHYPEVKEKQTHPPKPYTEATLLRAMETAGKQVDDEELREAMKENGIGRPSTRANIIETLLRRRYISKLRKNLIPTETGMQLIAAIKNDLLKSVELTGIWERKLRQIENGKYEASTFIEEMKAMVSELVEVVKHEQSSRIMIVEDKKGKDKQKKGVDKKRGSNAEDPGLSSPAKDQICPKCSKGKIIKGKMAYGCSAYREGCNFKIPFEIQGRKFTEKQIFALIANGKTRKMKGFSSEGQKVSGMVKLNEQFDPFFVIEEQSRSTTIENPPGVGVESTDKILCPKCGKGRMIKGRSAFGCSRFKEGCNFVVSFEKLQVDFQTDTLTKDILQSIH